MLVPYESGIENTAPYHRFRAFIEPGADRFVILSSLLRELGLSYRTLRIAQNRHLLVFPGASGRGTAPVVLVAHYDRAADSSGANDNSAAVFQLLRTAMILTAEGSSGWFIIFTDKEELGVNEGIQDQGAYGLAKNFRETVLGEGRFYIFDTCGVGDTLIISTMTDQLTQNEGGLGRARTRHLIRLLRDRALEIARNLNMSRVLLAPTPLSDDAGFLRAGIAAQTISVLPAEEAASLASLQYNKAFINGLIRREALTPEIRRLLPETWRSLNGPGDCLQRLTPEHYDQVIRFASALCGA